jgi:YbbR domain-containing protein
VRRLPVWVTRNWRLKVGCTILALITWVGVVYAGNPPETRAISVHVPQDPSSIPAGFVLVRPVPDLTMRIGGSRQNLDAFKASSLDIAADWRVVTHAGVQTIPLSIVNNDTSIELIDRPTSFRADIDALQSVLIPVTIVVTGSPPAGYEIVAESTAPDAVAIAGPHRELTGLQARVSVDLSNQKSNFVADEQAVLVYDAHNKRLNDVGITPDRVRVSISISANLTSRASAVLPRVVGNVAAGHQLVGISVTPTTVVLSGPQDLLNALDAVPTAQISLNGVFGNVTTVVTVNPPAGVSATPSSVTVTILVSALPTPAPTPTPTPASTP